MLRPKVHFTQVPLTVAKKALADELRRKKAAERAQVSEEKQATLEKVAVGERSKARIEMASPAFDIFQVQDSGVLWLGSAATAEDAKEQVRQMAARAPGKYLLFDQKTGTKQVMELHSVGGDLHLAGAQG
jgi:hypothetical protein